MIKSGIVLPDNDIKLYINFPKKDVLFFDIETTGFMVNRTQIYLIGCIYYENEQWHFTQFFATNKEEEAGILHGFFALAATKKCLICYNGTGFDIPYIQKKCQEHALCYSFDDFAILDIYKQIQPFQKLLKTENLKQKTMERYIGLFREDKYDGGELIKIFNEYKKKPDEELLNLLLLHNKEDILGMTEIITLLAYPALLIPDNYYNSTYFLSDNNELTFSINTHCPLPKKIMTGENNVFFVAENNVLSLLVKLSHTELKYFYTNYRDYYYLPKEDTAIHKSIAQFVDKKLRVKAKADNCYTKKTGLFVPQFKELTSPVFKYNLKDNVSYFEYDDNLFKETDFTKKYICQTVSYLLNHNL